MCDDHKLLKQVRVGIRLGALSMPTMFHVLYVHAAVCASSGFIPSTHFQQEPGKLIPYATHNFA